MIPCTIICSLTVAAYTVYVYVVYLAVILNLAVWRSFICLPNLNIVLKLLICIAATAFCQIKVTLAMITDQFAKYSTRQLIYLYGTTYYHILGNFQGTKFSRICPFCE